MNISRKTIVTFLAVSSLALGIGIASAGGGHHGDWCDRGPGHWGPHDWSDRGSENAADFKKRLEERRDRLHEALKLSPEQESAWKTFTEQA
ncbi:MAG: hypothetical protein LBB55_02065, partial [Zoogloeaceae bacterium]|nr:hypothetical protein [Zoogloeaceae bacterium]